jgi:16S rRNA (guanine527-N7)-methyltransferase
VKHPESADAIDDRSQSFAGEAPDQLLAAGLADLGVELSRAGRETALRYLVDVLEANRRLNLTRIVDPQSAVRLHLLDSLSASPELRSAPSGDVVDIGSGAGFPGVPLAIESRRDFTLLDSVGKKAAAVEEILRRPGRPIPARAVAGRAEDLARTATAGFAAVVARAVAPLPSLVELASPLLMAGGLLVALKGQPSDEEVLSGIRVAGIVGMEMRSSRQLTLPGSGERRTIVVFEKTGPPRINLPRRTGLAQHQPLA